MDMISPGIYTQIIDLSQYLNSTSGTIGFVPVITDQGPDNELVKVTGVEDYITKFGEPDIRAFGKYYGQGPYVALQHLSVSNDMYVVRALPDDATYSHAVVAATQVPKVPVEFLEKIYSVDEESVVEGTGEKSGEYISKTTDGMTAISIPLERNDLFAHSVVYGAAGTGETKEYIYVLDKDYDFGTGESQAVAKEELLNFGTGEDDKDHFVPVKSAKEAKYTTNVKYCAKKNAAMSSTQVLDSILDDSLILKSVNTDLSEKAIAYVRAIGRGSYYNSLSVKIKSDANPAKFGTYVFQVYQNQDDVDVMLESFNVSFDREALDEDGETLFIEDVVNKFSQYVRVAANEEGIIDLENKMQNYYKNDPTLIDITTEFGVNFPPKIPAVIDNGSGEKTVFPTTVEEAWSGEAEIPEDIELGYKAKMIWDAYVLVAQAEADTINASTKYSELMKLKASNADSVVGASGETVDINTAIQEAIDEMTKAREDTKLADEIFNWAQTLNLMNMADSDSVMYGEQPYALENGTLGSLVYVDPGTKKRKVDAVVGTQILCNAYTGLLKNPVVQKIEGPSGQPQYVPQFNSNVFDTDWIYFTIVYDAGYKSDVKQAALDLVNTYRRDCVLISDCGDNVNCKSVLQYAGTVKGGSDPRPWNSYLAARYEPYSKVYDKFTGSDIWVSPVYHMAKLLPQTDALYDIWYAAAGFKRGTLSEVKQLRWSANKSERDSLYLAQVNPIVHFPEGMTVFGQLTTQKISSTLSDLNCVRTVLYIKRAIEQYCRSFIFDHNDAATWEAIKQGIIPMLTEVQSNRGLTSFAVDVGATDYEYKTKTCHVNVTLQPTKVLEKIQLNMYIQ